MPGFLKSFANRWRDTPAAVAKVPFERFITGRFPNVEEYPFPYVSVLAGHSRLVYRSDKTQTYRRLLSLHIWVDPAALEDGEEISDMIRHVYANKRWRFNQGIVRDVLDGGPADIQQINEGTFQSWKLVRLLSAVIEEPRSDLGDNRPCDPAATSGSGFTSSHNSSQPSSRSSGILALAKGA